MKQVKIIIITAILMLFYSLGLSAQNAIIVQQSGDVGVTLAGADTMYPAATGQNLREGDAVSTGTNGRVLILLSDGTRLDLFPNSRMQIRNTGSSQATDQSILGELWESLEGKFTDSQYSSAQAGGVGAFRSESGDEEMFNDRLRANEQLEMEGLLASISSEELPENASRLMEAIVYETYGQFIPAEEIYLARIEDFPDDPVSYDMLFDMYLKMDFYGHAAEIIEAKQAVFE